MIWVERFRSVLACQDLVMESQAHSMWKQFHSHIPSRQGRA